jgi:hypothetical protein
LVNTLVGNDFIERETKMDVKNSPQTSVMKYNRGQMCLFKIINIIMKLLYLLQNDCESRKGYLVEITSASENELVKSQVGYTCKYRKL